MATQKYRIENAKIWHRSHKHFLWGELVGLIILYGLAFEVPYAAPVIAWIGIIVLARLFNTREWHRGHRLLFPFEILLFTTIAASLTWIFPSFSPLLVWSASIVLAVFVGIYTYFVMEFLTVIGLMWVPASVAAIAACLLFLSDQGLDLGVGLLGQLRDNWPKYILLSLVLFYWAIASWHAGRRSLDRRFPTFPALGDDQHFETWLRWPPRLLAICAHLFAAASLSLAAWGYLKAQGQLLGMDGFTGWALLALTTWGPVIIIGVGTIYVRYFDYSHTFESHYHANLKTGHLDTRNAERVWGVVLVVCVIIFFIMSWRENLPEGFSYAVLGNICFCDNILVFGHGEKERGSEELRRRDSPRFQ